MTPTKNTQIAAAAGVAVALAAAGGAYAASKVRHGSSPAAASAGGSFVAASTAQSSSTPRFGFRGGPLHGRGDDLAAAADYLGTTTEQLLTQLQSGKTLAQIADATSGKSASALIDALVAAEQKEHPDESASDIRARETAFANGTGFPGGPGFHHGAGDALATAAGYLGLTTQQLLTQLQSGKTLAQVADATSGKSASALIDALVAAEQKEHSDESASDIRTRVTAFVNGTGLHHPPPPDGTAPQPGTHI